MAVEKEHELSEQEMLNKTFRNAGQGVSLGEFTVALAYSGSNLEYVGWAAPGTGQGDINSWRIAKLSYSGSDLTDVQWASGKRDFDFEWDERVNYTYT